MLFSTTMVHNYYKNNFLHSMIHHEYKTLLKFIKILDCTQEEFTNMIINFNCNSNYNHSLQTIILIARIYIYIYIYIFHYTYNISITTKIFSLDIF